MLDEQVFMRIGPLYVYTYGVALAFGFVLAAIVAIRHTRKIGVRRHDVLDLMLWLMIVCVLAGRSAAVLSQWSEFMRKPIIFFSIPPGGISYYGALLAGFIVTMMFAARRNIRFWTLADALTPALALGITVGLGVMLSTNLLKFSSATKTWPNVILFTVIYGTTYMVWRRRRRIRFEGELTLLFFLLDSIFRIALNTKWFFGPLTDGSDKTPAIILFITCILWFTRRGATAHVQRPRRKTVRVLKRTRMTWLLGYVAFLALFMFRQRYSG